MPRNDLCPIVYGICMLVFEVGSGTGWERDRILICTGMTSQIDETLNVDRVFLNSIPFKVEYHANENPLKILKK